MNRVNKFIITLYAILDKDEYKDIIAWSEYGNGFQILNLELFKEIVLEKEFTHNNYATFLRQLNIYGFKCVKLRNNQKEYRHTKLLRGDVDALSRFDRKIKRKMQQQSQNIDEIYTFEDLEKSNKDLYAQIETIKLQQQRMLQQLKINQEIQQKIQANIVVVVKNKLHLSKKTCEDDEFGQTFLKVIGGMNYLDYIQASKYILESPINSPIQCYESPIPFYNSS